MKGRGDNLKKFVFVKRGKKSEKWKNDNYELTIKEGGYRLIKNGTNYAPFDSNLSNEDYIQIPVRILIIKNLKTGKKSQKECHQETDLVDEVQRDLENGKKQFSKIWEKID